MNASPAPVPSTAVTGGGSARATSRPVFDQHGALGSVGDGDEPAARDDLVLEPVDDEQVGLEVDPPGGRSVEDDERGGLRRGEHGLVRHLELAQQRALDRPRCHERVRAGRDDDLRLAGGVDVDERDAGLPHALELELDARRFEARERLGAANSSSPTAPIIRTFAPRRAAATAWFAPLPPG